MNINSAEGSLAKYHLLHFVIGVILAAILLAVPKLIDVLLTVALAAFFLPVALLPDFTRKWLDHAALLVGAILVALVFHFLGKL